MKSAISLCFFLVLGFAVRCYNHASVFVGGQIYFVDGDCYSRMTRVRMILEHPFSVIHHQYFENYPQGIVSHATAPFDYLIAFLAVLLKPFSDSYLDLAGAFVSPLLALAMIAFLWDWSRRLKLPHAGIMLLFFAISPILVHGTVLGRPDHQSLEMLCIVVGLGAEWGFSQRPSREWGMASGVAWGLGLWVSLYEPLILLVLTVILYLIFDRQKLWAAERSAGYAVFGAIMALMLLVDGLPVSPPDQMLLDYFPRWEKNIGELGSLGIRGLLFFNDTTLYGWMGLGFIAAPVLLVLRCREDKRAIPLLVMFLAVFGLTLWQVRWGYFSGIFLAMSLPFLFTVFRKPGIVWGVFIVSLVPVAIWGWKDGLLSDKTHAVISARTKEAVHLRFAAEAMKSDRTLPLIAPWWVSPELAYWSGQPAVAGSSHESMPGIVDSSRFYLTDDDGEAKKILRDRGVKYVIAADPRNVLLAASGLLDRPIPESSMAEVLFTRPHSAPDFLKLKHDYFTIKLFEVETGDAMP